MNKLSFPTCLLALLASCFSPGLDGEPLRQFPEHPGGRPFPRGFDPSGHDVVVHVKNDWKSNLLDCTPVGLPPKQRVLFFGGASQQINATDTQTVTFALFDLAGKKDQPLRIVDENGKAVEMPANAAAWEMRIQYTQNTGGAWTIASADVYDSQGQPAQLSLSKVQDPNPAPTQASGIEEVAGTGTAPERSFLYAYKHDWLTRVEVQGGG